MPIKDNIKHFLWFNRGERFGLIVLFAILLGIIFANIFVPGLLKGKHANDLNTFKKEINDFEKEQKYLKDSISRVLQHLDAEQAYVDHLNPFPFDPNHLPEEKWSALGLNANQIKIIKHYEARGGHFYKADDLAKIYSISQAEFEVLKPYIRIEEAHGPNVEISTIQPFDFNPNTIDKAGLIRMGLSEALCNTIVNYRKKGGHFYEPDDLEHIYNLDPAIYQKLKPFIIIPIDTSLLATQKRLPKVMVDLNHADTLDLQQINGIGPSFARRIYKYGKRLGGYYQKEQLLDVFGMDSLRYKQIADHIYISGSDSLEQININTATIKELIKHPYIEFYLAKSIITQREKVGQYSSLDELQDARLVYEALFNKIKPYLTL